MKSLMNIFEVLVGDVSINLGGSNIAMAKQRLDGSQISTVHQQVGGKTVAHSMWADMFRNAGQSCVLANHALNAAGR